jgi:hypothetical protein
MGQWQKLYGSEHWRRALKGERHETTVLQEARSIGEAANPEPTFFDEGRQAVKSSLDESGVDAGRAVGVKQEQNPHPTPARKAIPPCMASNDYWDHVCARSRLDRLLSVCAIRFAFLKTG